MMPTRSMTALLISAGCLVLSTWDRPAAQSGCAPLLVELDRQSRAESFREAAGTFERIVGGGICDGAQIDVARARLSNALLRAAVKLEGDPARGDDYRNLLRQAVGYHASWQAAWRLGDVEMKRRAFADAAAQYQSAIEQLADAPPSQGVPAVAENTRRLMMRADEARLLAAEGVGGQRPTFVSAVRSLRSAEPGGVYNASLRGLEATKVPPPITFLYDKAEFTDIGRQAAEELVQVLRLRHPGRITVTGHTDRRGSADYNRGLSKRRAEAVVSYLKSNGIQAAYVAVGKGFDVARALSADASYEQSEIDALNRRVEIDWGTP